MQNEFIFVGILILCAILLPAGGLITAWVLRPHKPNEAKKSTYECGIETIGDTWVQFKVGYYLFAILFLVFDVEVAFLVPWAVVFKDVGSVAFIEILIFLIILGLGLLYAWKKGALKWE